MVSDFLQLQDVVEAAARLLRAAAPRSAPERLTALSVSRNSSSTQSDPTSCMIFSVMDGTGPS